MSPLFQFVWLLTKSIVNIVWVNLHDDSVVNDLVDREEDVFKVMVKRSLLDVLAQDQRDRVVYAVEYTE